MRIDFDSHYGSEYYCPVSLLRVYGITQMDKFRQEQDEEAATKAAEGSAIDESEIEGEEEEEKAEEEQQAESSSGVTTATVEGPVESTASLHESPPVGSVAAESPAPISSSTPVISDTISADPTALPISPAAPPSPTPPPTEISTALPSLNSTQSEPLPTPTTSLVVVPSVSSSSTATPISTASKIETTEFAKSAESSSSSSPVLEESRPATSTLSAPSESTATSSSSTGAISSTTSISSSSSSRPVAEPTALPARIVTRNETRPVVPPTPQTGDSIYGTIMKRLSGLEHNHTLAMHYIEAQSTMIRTAFINFEQRLHELAGSVSSNVSRSPIEIDGFDSQRQSQDSAIRLALLDLERYRLDLDRDRLDLSTKLNALTQEVRLPLFSCLYSF